MDIVFQVVIVLVPMILSLTVHEFAHAWSAKLLGDDTAEHMGRLTLNPIPHIDPIGTLLVPGVLTVWGGGFFFGWAKPVPVNPTRFTRKVTMRTGMLIVSAAGPFSNVLQAFLYAGILSALVHSGTVAPIIATFLRTMVLINVVLAVFNMIPVGPLDGQKVLSGMLSGDAAMRFERFNQQYGMWLLIGVIILANQTGLIGRPLRAILSGLQTLFDIRLGYF